jgi:hypothetical protein
MAAHGDRLSRKREQALAALLSHPTIATAASAAGVNEKTLRGWLKEPGFKAAYAEARAEILERTVARLLRASESAVRTLEAALDAERTADSIRAARIILELAVKGTAELDLEARLAALEQGDGRQEVRR